jgi:uncharacterized RDD family membrane protein YckC
MEVTPVVPGISAGLGRRTFAALVDWAICLFVPLLAAGGLWLFIVPLSVVVYFAFFLARGRTPGMKAASIRILDRETGQPPRARKAFARSLAALLQAAAMLVCFVFAFSDVPTRGYSAADFAVLAASTLVAVSAVVAHLWMSVDPERQTLLDRLFGVAIGTT